MSVETIMANHAELRRIASANLGQISVWRFELEILQHTRRCLLQENSISAIHGEAAIIPIPPEVQELTVEIRTLSETIRNAMKKLCPHIDFPTEV